jgi:hypothetical protein
MKTTIPLLIAMVIGSVTASAQTRFGFVAGATYSNWKTKSGSGTISGDYKIGFTTGLILDIPFYKTFSFQPAYNFTQKGTRYDDEYSSVTITLNYVEFPLNFVYKAKPNEGFFIGAGPSIAYGWSGNNKEEIKPSGEKHSEDIYFGSEKDELKSFSLGGNLIAGYNFKKGLLFSAGYNFDLTDMSNFNDQNKESTLKSNYFSLKVGWIFPSKKNNH